MRLRGVKRCPALKQEEETSEGVTVFVAKITYNCIYMCGPGSAAEVNSLSSPVLGCFVLPGYARDMATASHMECVEPSSLLPGTRVSRCHIQQYMPNCNTSIVDRQIGLHRQLGRGLSTCETTES